MIGTISFDIDGKSNDGVVILINGIETEIYEGEYEVV